MIALDEIALLRPAWLLALIAVALAAVAARRAGLLDGWQKAVDPHLLAAMERRGGIVPGPGSANYLAVIAAAIMVAALAGPAMLRADAGAFRNLDGVVIVADLSPRIGDRGAIGEVRAAAQIVSAAAGTRQTALVVYSGDAFLASPFTTDKDLIGGIVFALETDIVPVAGARPDRAIEFAHRMLEDAGMVTGDVILISSSEGLGRYALETARDVADAGYSVHALHIAGNGAEKALIDALATDGRGASGDLDDPRPVIAEIEGGLADHLGSSNFAVLAWNDFGRLVLALAVVPMLLLFRRTA